MATILRKLTAVVSADTTGFHAGMKGVANKAGTTSKAVIGSSLAIGAAVAGIGLAALKAAAGFETALAEIETIAGVSKKGMARISNDLLSLSEQFGSTAQDNAKGFYQTVSSGITDTKDAMTVMRRANELAIAGLTSQETAVNVLTAAMNAYGFSARDAARVNDILFTTVKLGRTRIGELSGALGRIMPIAANVGIKFEELNAALVATTLGGMNTNEAVTSLRALINSLINPAEGAAKALEEAGVSFGMAALRAKGLQGIMKELGAALRDPNTNIAKLIPNIRAMPAALLLAGSSAEKFDKALREMANNAGAAKNAAKTMADTLDRKWKKALASVNRALIDFGSILQGPVGDGLVAWARGMRTLSIIVKENADELKYWLYIAYRVIDPLGLLEMGFAKTTISSKALSVEMRNAAKASGLFTKTTEALNRSTKKNASALLDMTTELSKVTKETEPLLKERTAAFRSHFASLTSMQRQRQSELDNAASAERSALQNLVSIQEQGAAARLTREQRKAGPGEAAKLAFKEAARLSKKAAEFQGEGKSGIAGDLRGRSKALLEGIERDAVGVETSMASKIARLREEQNRLKERFREADTSKARAKIKEEFKENRQELKAAEAAIIAAKAREAKAVSGLTAAQTAAEKLAQEALDQTTEKRKTAQATLTEMTAKIAEFKLQAANLTIDIKTETSEERVKRLITLTQTLINKQKELQGKIAAAQVTPKAATAGAAPAATGAPAARTSGTKTGPQSVTVNVNVKEKVTTKVVSKIITEIERRVGRKQTATSGSP